MLLIAMVFSNPLFLIGAILCLFAGLCKVLWKIIVVLKKKNIWWMFLQMRICMPIGFLMMVLSIFLKRKEINFHFILKTILSFPSVIFFGLGLLGMTLMIIFAFTLDGSSLKSNWIEQLTNGIAQMFIFTGVLIILLNSYISMPIPVRKVQFDSYSGINLESLPDNITWSQNLLLVNASHPLPEDFAPDISYYKDTDVLMNTAIIEDYKLLSQYILDTYDNKLFVESSYRSHEDQIRVYQESASGVAARPGESEHETGLSLDVYVKYFAGSGFADAPEGQYVNNNCQNYGFIIRYPRGKTDITGIKFEPWHIRYVGHPHSELIAGSNKTLEEYIGYFKPGLWYSYEDYLISKQEKNSIKIPGEYVSCPTTLSPDNTGYIFVTIQKNQQ